MVNTVSMDSMDGRDRVNSELLAAFRTTDYLVNLDTANWACIRIDQLLPDALLALTGDQAWGVLTAWNPYSTPRAWPANLAAQATLLDALKNLPRTKVVLPAVGIGAGGWHEPSLFVIGPDAAALDLLGRHHQQNGYVQGSHGGPARLRLLAP